MSLIILKSSSGLFCCEMVYGREELLENVLPGAWGSAASLREQVPGRAPCLLRGVQRTLVVLGPPVSVEITVRRA